jgi:hypothetical protein
MEMTSVMARDRGGTCFGGRFNFVWGDKLSSKNKQK